MAALLIPGAYLKREGRLRRASFILGTITNKFASCTKTTKALAIASSTPAISHTSFLGGGMGGPQTETPLLWGRCPFDVP